MVERTARLLAIYSLLAVLVIGGAIAAAVQLMTRVLRVAGDRLLARLLAPELPEAVAMKIAGHKTDSAYRRYNIVSGKDIRTPGRSWRSF